jgi:RNA polymerase sigma factor (sigma-70 family)
MGTAMRDRVLMSVTAKVSLSERQRLLTEQLYERHALRAFRFAYVVTGNREQAEDLTQEAFSRAFARIDTIQDSDAFGGYLRTTLLNLARAQHRRGQLERLSLLRSARRERTNAEGLPFGVEERERLWIALHRLPYRQRAALVLRYYEDLSEREAARTLGVSVASLKGLVARGIGTLRLRIIDDEGGSR